MANVTRDEGHLVVAAVRVLAHRNGGSPTPEQTAELLGWAPEALRLKVSALHELGILHLVVSAYENHLEIRDHLLLEQLEQEQGTAMSEAMAEFEQRKREEAERMSRLFADGDQERRQQDRLRGMDEGLLKFERGKPRNPFGDDSGS